MGIKDHGHFVNVCLRVTFNSPVSSFIEIQMCDGESRENLESEMN